MGEAMHFSVLQIKALLKGVSLRLASFIAKSRLGIMRGDAQVDALSSAVLTPQQQLIEKLLVFMEIKKPYLEHHITVERLAIKLCVSPKLLSSSINGELNKNFFEFINYYRINEAKKQLANSEYKDLTINEIMKNCGFSSKSVFNQAFKRSVGLTPSYYRVQEST